MQQKLFKVLENKPLTAQVFCLRLQGEVQVFAPGQFVNIKLPNFYLRRPISICDWDENSFTLIYKVVGAGTENLSKLKAGDELDLLFPLGNGFNIEPAKEKPLLIGGGVGVPPLFGLCKTLLKHGSVPTVLLGFNTKKEVFLEEEFKKLGVSVTVTTVDGNYGQKGFVTDVLPHLNYTYFYTCGPLPMLKAVWEHTETEGQLSFEARMGCGFGACRGCTVQTKNGPKRICMEGPVLTKGEVIW